MDACQFYSGENDGLMTGHLHSAAAPPPLSLVHTRHNISLQWGALGTVFLVDYCLLVAFGKSASAVWDTILDTVWIVFDMLFNFYIFTALTLRVVLKRGNSWQLSCGKIESSDMHSACQRYSISKPGILHT